LEGSYIPAAILRRWSLTPRDPPDEPRGDDWTDEGASGGGPRCYPLWYLDPIDNRAWLQFWVGLYCRMAHTMATGAIGSKKAGVGWAVGALDPHWRAFIERTQEAGKGTPEGFDPIPAEDADQ